MSLILLGQDQLALELLVGRPPPFHSPYGPVITAKGRHPTPKRCISVPPLLPQCSSRQPQIVLDIELRRLIVGGRFNAKDCANPPVIVRCSHGL